MWNPRSMTDDIARVTTPLRLDEGRFGFDVADGWQQGRGAFGGLVLAAMARALEYRPTSSAWNRGHQRVEGWIRFREASRGIGAPEIVALCDSYYPAAWGTEPAPRPMSTLAFTIEIVADLTGLGATDPYFYRAHVAAAHDGFSVEFRELWHARGRLLALNQQVFVYVK